MSNSIYKVKNTGKIIIMKYLFTSIAICTYFLTTLSNAEIIKTTNIDSAIEQAKKTKKNVFIKFTGSGWCEACTMIDENVFSKKEFKEELNKDFVLCVVDFQQSDEESVKKIKPLLKKYQVNALPTVILLDQEGNEFNRFIASLYPSVKEMLDQLKLQLKRKNMF